MHNRNVTKKSESVGRVWTNDIIDQGLDGSIVMTSDGLWVQSGDDKREGDSGVHSLLSNPMISLLFCLLLLIIFLIIAMPFHFLRWTPTLQWGLRTGHEEIRLSEGGDRTSCAGNLSSKVLNLRHSNEMTLWEKASGKIELRGIFKSS